MEHIVDIKSPFTGGKVKEVITTEEQLFRKERYVVKVRYYECIDSGERFTTTEQDEMLFEDLYSQYRRRHGLPFPDEIRDIRQSYGLNHSQITKILGFGTNQYANYENGQVPSISNGKLINAVKNKEVMLDLLEQSKNEFTDKEYSKISKLVSGYTPKREKADTATSNH